MRTLLALLLAVAALCRPCPAQDPEPSPPAMLTFEAFQERVWVGIMMSSAAARPDGLNGPENNWGMGRWPGTTGRYAELYTNVLEPLIAKGWTRFLIHQPYGEDRKGLMDFDARLDAQARGFTAPMDFGAMLRRLKREHPGVRVIVYLGALEEESMSGLLERGKRLSWLDRMRRSTLDILDVEICDLAIDHSAALAVDSVEWQAAELLFTMLGEGRSGWIEAVPWRKSTHHHGCNVIAVESFWDRSRPPDETLQPGFADSAWAAPSAMLTGRILRWDTRTGRGGDFAGAIADVLKAGERMEWAGGLMYYPGDARALWEEVISLLAPPPAVEVEGEVGVLLDGPPGAELTRGVSMSFLGDVAWAEGGRVEWTWPRGTTGRAVVHTMTPAEDRRKPIRRRVVQTPPVDSP